MAQGDQHTESIHRILLRLPNRRRLYEAIVATPGTHARRLSRDLGMALGIVEHHVRQLARHGLVFSHQAGRRRTYYAVGQIDQADVPWLHALRKPAWGPLARALLVGECGVSTLAGRVDAPPSTVSYQLRRMRDAGLVEALQVGRESVYVVREPARVERLLSGWSLHLEGASPDGSFAGVFERADLTAQAAAREQPLASLAKD